MLLIWFLSQFPIIHIPLTFIGTWVHELGHGIGAIITGGQFDRMIVLPNLSGVAYTYTSGPAGFTSVLVTGLLAPALAGAFMLILSRGLRQGRLAMLILCGLLLLSGVIWAGDLFTRATVLCTGAIIGLIALKGNQAINLVTAQILAISFCLNAVADIDYFFARAANSGGQTHHSDTDQLTQTLGMTHTFWAIVLTVIALAILFFAARISGHLARSRR